MEADGRYYGKDQRSLCLYTTFESCDRRPKINSKRHDVRPRNFARRSVSYMAWTWTKSSCRWGVVHLRKFYFF